ncbi:hypothetical protein [Actinoplanes sp. OR16]|uniref:hypothetical protein n=1 Tax=Actinoplanes sp. OR16 TaxID=946334 RepID=UPI000FD94FD1|nr:hypothetical protein [Actinoplanes sp. OR16]
MRDVLKSLEATPPPPARTTTDDIIGRARRTQAWRSVAMGTGAAACLAVAVAASASVVTRPGPGDAAAVPNPSFSAPPPVRTDPPLPVQKIDFSSELGQYRVGAYRIGPAVKVTGGYTELPVYHDGTTLGGGSAEPLEVATIAVYDKGLYDTALFGGAGDSTLIIGDQYPVTVDGRAGLGRDWTYISPIDPAEQNVVAALAWQYADDAWATLLPNYGGPDLAREQATQIAAGLTTSSRRDLKVPYRLRFLPKGWQAVAVRQALPGTTDTVSEVFLHQGPVADPATRIDEVLPGHVKITVMKGLEPGDVEGVHCITGRQSCTVVTDDYRIYLDGYGGLPDADIKRVAEGVQPRDPSDQKAWLKVNF